MARPPKPNPERDALYRKLFTEKLLTARQIALRVGTTREAVHYHLRRLGLVQREVHDNILRKMHAEGARPADIARVLDVSPQSLFQRARVLGFSLAKPKRVNRLQQIYERCMAGDPNWLNVEERSRNELRRLMLEELRSEEREKSRRGVNTRELQEAIALWEREESKGPRAVEAVRDRRVA